MSHLGQGMSLVGVESTLHEHDGDPVQGAEEQPGLVARHRRLGKVGDVGVGEHVHVVQEIAQAS